jgi:hypothetical protein
MKSEGSLPHSQVPASYSYPKPDQSSPCLLIKLLKYTFSYSPPIYDQVFQMVSPAFLVRRINFYSDSSVGRDSSVGIATRYGMDGPGIESPWRARYSAPVQTGPGFHPASYTMGTGSLTGLKRLERGVEYPNHPAPKLKKELYISTSGPSWPVLG